MKVSSPELQEEIQLQLGTEAFGNIIHEVLYEWSLGRFFFRDICRKNKNYSPGKL